MFLPPMFQSFSLPASFAPTLIGTTLPSELRPMRRAFRLPIRTRGDIRKAVDEELAFHMEAAEEELFIANRRLIVSPRPVPPNCREVDESA